ncbi:mucin-7 [Meles meles]|uniref:mucin-7 n=1 Tax=Meles meles TaxID=9662 RepID=UPI001E69E27C|nr:mucin-7 [Meles meles]
MKTLTLLVCLCALSACFSLSEGRKKPRKIHHKKNDVQQLTLDRKLPLYPKFQPNWNILIKKHLISGPHKYPKHPHSNRRKPKPKYPPPSKCPVKNNTADGSNPAATTQIPSFSSTSPGVTPFIATTTSAGQGNTSSSATTPSPQPSPALSDTTAATPTSSLPSEPSSAPLVTTSEPSSAPLVTTSEPSSAPLVTTSEPSSAPLVTTSEPSSAPLGTTAAQITTPNPSPTSSAPETSQTTAAPTIETSTPATTHNTTVEQTTSPSSQNANYKFWQYIYEILKYISGVPPNK